MSVFSFMVLIVFMPLSVQTKSVCDRDYILFFSPPTKCSTKPSTEVFIEYIYDSLIFCVCMWVFVWVGAHACLWVWVCMWRSKTTLSAVSQTRCTFLFLETESLVPLGSRIRLGWLAIETQATTYLYLSSSSVTSECLCIQLGYQALYWMSHSSASSLIHC